MPKSLHDRPRVFISYAREDLDSATQVYERLQAAGFEPWLDKQDILPGERWERSIWKAVRRSHFFLACMSTRSTNKRGFLQKELRQAINIWEEKLENDIYLIPVRLEDCEVPESLIEFEWVNLFETNGWDLLIKSIREGWERLSGQPAMASGRASVTKHKMQETKDVFPKYRIDLEIPQLTGTRIGSLEEMNIDLYGFVLRKVHQFRKSGFWASSTEPDSWWADLTNELNVTYDVTLFSDDLLSLKLNFYEYGAGAAHGQFWTVAFNYQLNPIMSIELFEMFRDAGHLKVLSDYCVDDLLKQAEQEILEESDSEGRERIDAWIREGAAPDEDKLSVFSLTNDSLVITFDPYQVGYYAWGTRQVVIPLTLIKDDIDPSGPMRTLVSNLE